MFNYNILGNFFVCYFPAKNLNFSKPIALLFFGKKSFSLSSFLLVLLLLERTKANQDLVEVQLKYIR